MTLYILDKPYIDSALLYIEMESECKILLLHDALYIDSDRLKGKDVFVINKEVNDRGLERILPMEFKRAGYDEIIDLIVENKVINFA